MPDTIATLRARHEAELSAAVRVALEASGWRVLAAARLLDTDESTIRRLIGGDKSLSAEYRRHSPGRGRPREALPAQQGRDR